MSAPTPGCVIFLHIPRTAGTSFRRVAQRQYEPASIRHCYSDAPPEALARLYHMPSRERAAVRLLLGHIPFGVHELVPEPNTYITLLRHPARRVFSEYRYVLANPKHVAHERLAGAPDPLSRFLGDEALRYSVDNGMVRGLAACLEPGLGGVTRDHLATAIEHMESRFVVAGLVEHFDETLIFLRRRLGWSRLYYERENAVPSGRGPDAEDVAAILERNALDLELYEYARNRFEAEVTAAGGAFAAELDAFRTHLRRVRDTTAELEGELFGPKAEGETADLDRAQALADALVALDDEYALGHHYKSYLCALRGDGPGAAEYAADALERDPFDPRVVKHAARVLSDVGECAASAKILRHYLRRFDAHEHEMAATLDHQAAVRRPYRRLLDAAERLDRP